MWNEWRRDPVEGFYLEICVLFSRYECGVEAEVHILCGGSDVMNGFQITSLTPAQDKLYVTRECITEPRVMLWLLYRIKDDCRSAVM